MLPAHLDLHFSDLPLARPVFGEVTVVYPYGHPENWSDGLTLYQCVTNQHWPMCEEVLPPCYALGQLFALQNGKDDYEDTLSVGDQVVMLFLEFDHNRPVILSRVATWDHVSPSAREEEMPRTRYRRRHFEAMIDKEGHGSVRMAPGKTFEVRDKDGQVRHRWTEAGGQEIYNAQGGIQARYKADGSSEILDANGDVRVTVKANGDVELGGNGGKRLLTEDFVGKLAQAIATAVHSTGDGGATLKTNIASALNAALTNDSSTSKLKAK